MSDENKPYTNAPAPQGRSRLHHQVTPPAPRPDRMIVHSPGKKLKAARILPPAIPRTKASTPGEAAAQLRQGLGIPPRPPAPPPTKAATTPETVRTPPNDKPSVASPKPDNE